MKFKTLLILMIPILTSCAPAQYKKADLGWYGGQQEYLDKKISEDTYILEYSHIGGYNYSLQVSKGHWETRAKELCPNGYEGGYEVVHPAYARIEEFVCPQRFCGSYPLVSGIIKCK